MEQRTVDSIKKYVSEVSVTLEYLPVNSIARSVARLSEARLKAKKVYLFGNGGSAATASHFACDLNKGAICKGRPMMKAFALTDNVSGLSAWANDTDYNNIFAAQLTNFIEAGDVAIGISGSGDSINVINGVTIAKRRGATTIGLIGFDGGKLKDYVDIGVIVPSHNIRQVEDIHLLLAHVVTTCLAEEGLIEAALIKSRAARIIAGAALKYS
jgi:D-sedoheptulose 7-phosphate isomerase